MDRTYNILICPLEWGLGHATRMIPVARKLREMNHKITIASGKEHLSLFRNELPGLSYLEFSGFRPGYSRFLPQYLTLLLKTPLLLYHIIREHFMLGKIIRENAIDIVISDNRFGLWNKDVTTVYVTHMPLIPFPKPFGFLEFIGINLHRSIIRRYTFCFIPDLPGKLNISGRLSHGIRLPDNVRYIGILSRFLPAGKNQSDNNEVFQHNTFILSGPEPQRGILKQKLVNVFKDKDPISVVLEGRPDKKPEIGILQNIRFYNHLPSFEMAQMIAGSKSIVTRSGYTTIMELIGLNCSALLIPTPGQTEQEYLAEYLSEKGWFSTIQQGRINTNLSLPTNKPLWSAEIIEQSNLLLEKALEDLLESHYKKD